MIIIIKMNTYTIHIWMIQTKWEAFHVEEDDDDDDRESHLA